LHRGVDPVAFADGNESFESGFFSEYTVQVANAATSVVENDNYTFDATISSNNKIASNITASYLLLDSSIEATKTSGSTNIVTTAPWRAVYPFNAAAYAGGLHDNAGFAASWPK